MKDTRQQQQHQQQNEQQGTRRQQANNLTTYYPFGSQGNAEAPVGCQHSEELRDLLLTMTPAEGRDIGPQQQVIPSLWFETPETRRMVEGMSQEERRARTVSIMEAALSLVEDDEDLSTD
jgi:hypothetical protein